MGTMQWVKHFERSVRRERWMGDGQPLRLPPELRQPLVGTLQVFQRGLSSSGHDLRTKVREHCDADYARAVDLYVQEKNIHAEMLAQLLWAAGSHPRGRHASDFLFRRVRRRLDWLPELALLLSVEIASVPYFKMLAHHVDEARFCSVLNDITSDQAYHLGFHIDHLRPALAERSASQRIALQQAWVGLFANTLAALLFETRDVFRTLDLDRHAYWTDAWNLFAQVQSGLHGSAQLGALLTRDPRLKFVV